MQFQWLVMSRMHVYVTADLYQAKWPDKPRIVWRYKIKMLLLVHEYTLFVCIIMEQTFETLLEEMKHDTDVLEETFPLYLESVLFRAPVAFVNC